MLPSNQSLCASGTCVPGTTLSLHHLRARFGHHPSDKPATFHRQTSLTKEDRHWLSPRSSAVLCAAWLLGCPSSARGCPYRVLATQPQEPSVQALHELPSAQLHRARPSHYAVLLGTGLKTHPSVLEPFCRDTEHVLNGAKKFKWEEIIA